MEREDGKINRTIVTEKTEIERAILKEAIKHTITRIKNLKKTLETQKVEKKEMGGYEDCGQFYCDEVMRTEAKIEVLVSQKISFEKWRKKLSYEQSDLQD